MLKLSVSSHFDSAHYLRGYEGPCANLHGHTWKYTVVIEGEKSDDLGMLIDFKYLKKMMSDMEKMFDHKCINEVSPFTSTNPTAENLATYMYFYFRPHLPTFINIVSVTVNESDDCSATYFEEDK